jgi:hypothetical protein
MAGIHVSQAAWRRASRSRTSFDISADMMEFAEQCGRGDGWRKTILDTALTLRPKPSAFRRGL